MKLVIIFNLMLFLFISCNANISKSKKNAMDRREVVKKKSNHIVAFDSTKNDSIVIIETDSASAIEVLFDTLRLHPFDTIQLVFENEYSLGKLWILDETSDSLKLLNRRKPKGKTKQQFFFFQGQDVGEYNLKFENKRPFGNPGEVKIINQTIIVK